MIKNIDFKTSHNIVISYPLATFGHRILAFFIDFLLVYLLYMIIKIGINENSELQLLVGTILFFLYHLICELTPLGQSLGKYILKIKVYSLDGTHPTISQTLIRWSFRLADIGFTLGFLAIGSIYTSIYGQRIGDLFAGTTVVKISRDWHGTLQDLQQLRHISTENMNPLLSQFNDSQMLKLKQLLARYRRYPTDENYELLIELSKKIRKITNEAPGKYDPVYYLEKSLNDYVILTR
jgi:uncharacterized RDD family membrane protein YckC